MDHYLLEPESHFDEDVSAKQKRQSISAQETVTEDEHGSFDCNICLDSVKDPVVTICGHLYCWACIYKWLRVQRSSEEDQQQQNCPVCKADISGTSLVPLYGHGKSTSNSAAKRTQLDLVIPPRPNPSGIVIPSASSTTSNLHPNLQLHPNFFHSPSQPYHNQQYLPGAYGGYAASVSSNFGGTTMASFFNPNIGMFGEMVLARISGSSDADLFAYPDAYSLMRSSRPRTRRLEMQRLEESFNRVFIFLFCCLVLCLLLF